MNRKPSAHLDEANSKVTLPENKVPLHDPWGRAITYLRISVTDKCNYRCFYCMPSEGVVHKPHADILRHEQIAHIATAAGQLGFTKVKITGGEPLVRRGIEKCIELIAQTQLFTDIGLTTNGSLLTIDKAGDLKNAGIQRINISLDTLDPDRFSMITRGGRLADVLHGIDAALHAGFVSVKINMVLLDQHSEHELDTMREFCISKGLHLQTIARFSLLERFNSPASYTDRPASCDLCNRIRLTCDGFFKPCLFSDTEVKVAMDDPHASIKTAIQSKPAHGFACTLRKMYQIGG